jgi:hypothetical protein
MQVARAGEPKGHSPSRATLVREVMGFLLSGVWVKGEAKLLGVKISSAAVRNEFETIKAQQFHSARKFHAFLRKTRQTTADLMYRMELNLLSARIQQHVIAGRRTSSEREEALKQFVTSFREHWTSETYCAPGYGNQDCGHVQALS